ncbi:endo alpha-1,4 polygalactosaminidase [Pseudenhygromyxa sp. WMMC2535]|uniref:endo alpha-1,4 polygalactosaminidase n=1 Tax=Pseudenhygromyxa sp. WMMC2535 TaxID=2712867 RepID=UPI001551B5E4|nr:endo alpha-1,4 polygalactosaminidase [Pseudenhygromyxa sp. WMMC2535]NVB38737.1 endo alpha-1,4 polygalactosaminidase [Pseudenhygromyxa sp. WMMC2535]
MFNGLTNRALGIALIVSCGACQWDSEEGDADQGEDAASEDDEDSSGGGGGGGSGSGTDSGSADTNGEDVDTEGTGSGETASGETEGSGTDSGETDTQGGADTGSLPISPLCVWNQAYQENYEADTVEAILADAQSCYVLIDPFDSSAAREAIPQIRANNNIVGCYISVGTCEDWRDDFDELEPHCVDTPWGQWAGEYFIDLPDAEVVEIMGTRIDQLADWGCDMVEFDNMDWAYDQDYKQEYGFTVTETEAEAYSQALCDRVHDAGMWCMAKNTAQGAEGFEGGTFESYTDDLDWWESDHLQGFLDAGGLGVIVHYDENDCEGALDDYMGTYGEKLSFICEDPAIEGYQHFD